MALANPKRESDVYAAASLIAEPLGYFATTTNLSDVGNGTFGVGIYRERDEQDPEPDGDERFPESVCVAGITVRHDDCLEKMAEHLRCLVTPA